ncbi:MAG: aminopeptidase [Caulobacteraceae bacterium]|nr:aminopeptidase [Caulobacteraceae bacterium]
MFAKIAAFELRYQLRQPVFWVTFAVFFLLTFGSMTVDQIQIGSGGNVHKNSPFSIAQIHFIWSLFYMFATTAFVANVVVRDDETGYGPIIRSTRVSKFAYLDGRFTGAFIAVSLAFLSVPLAIWLGSLTSLLGWVDPETLGPNKLEYYAWAMGVMALPNIFLTASLFFVLATTTRSMMATYLGVVGFLVAYFTVNALTNKPEFEQMMALWDPLGAGAFGYVTEYWTAFERNGKVPALAGYILYNRLIWIGIGLAALTGAYALFRFQDPGVKARKAEKNREIEPAAEVAIAPPPSHAGPLPKPATGGGAAWAQLAARTRFEMRQVFLSPAFLVLMALGLFNSFGGLWFSNQLYGGESYPVTTQAIPTLLGAFSLIPMLIAIYYAGELVWRERDRRTHEIIDATALPDWAFVIPKTLAITLVLISTLIVSVVASVLIQAAKGYFGFELDKYLLWYVLPYALDWALLAALAVFLQTISPHKFIGWGLMGLYLILTIVASQTGWDHNLYIYGGATGVPLSDMNGAGDYLGYSLWFRAYWTAFALILLVLAHVLWRRGTETRLMPRLKRAPRRLAGPAGVLAGVALVAFVGLGGYIFYNTNVLNEYRNRQNGERWQADYEKTLLRYEKLPRPLVRDVKLAVDLDPHAPHMTTRGSYVLENATGAPLSEVHLRFDRDVKVTSLALPGATLAREFPRFNYRIYKLATPMAPGEKRTLTFSTEIGQRGFRNSGNTTRLVGNGTFVNNSEFAPTIGMDRSGVLQDRAIRRKYGLPPELRPPKLEDESARKDPYFPVDWVTSDITITTVADQTPIAPGYKVSDVTKDGRRTARFVTEAPILHFFSIQSADYLEKHKAHKGVDLVVYYDKHHPWNVDRMLNALAVGLDYYQANFSPYQFRQARIIEFPGYETFAQAFAGTMPYSERIGFVAKFDDPEKIDYVTYVTAHELGHQWWAHQVIGSNQQGATVLSETQAQYSALMVMEKIYGPDQIRKFLKFELDRYLRSRGGEVIEELPLARVENQGYIHYQKGGLVMYLLRDMVGEEAVNRALRRVLAQYAFKGAPYPRSTDLVNALRAEVGPEHQQLITDLFEKITLYDLKATDPKVTRRPDGRFDVVMTVEAKKLYADGKGKETEAALLEPFDIGLFTAEPGRKTFDAKNVVFFEKRPIRSGRQELRFVVDRAPTYVGVDPYNKRIDRNSDDNVIKVGG